MNKHFLKITFLLSVFFSQQTFAVIESEIVGTQAYARGNYVEVGVNANGFFGAVGAANVPAGYHDGRFNAAGANEFGFVSNPLKITPWLDTSDYDGDFFTPGNPAEGFGYRINGTTERHNNGDGTTGIPGGSITGVDTGTLAEHNVANIYWSGTRDGLQIDRTITVSENSFFILLTVTLTNISGSTITDVYWSHEVDPDNNVQINGGTGDNYVTINSIESQPGGFGGQPDLNDRAIVLARQDAQSGYTDPDIDGSNLYLLAVDPRARVVYATSGLTIKDAEGIHDGTANNTVQTVGNTDTDDAAIGIAFQLGDMANGEAITIRYAYNPADDNTDILDIFSLKTDYGDAPDTYGTTEASGNPATHQYVSGLFLGTRPSGDGDGFVDGVDDSAGAATDDSDDDGISVFPAIATDTTSYTLSVSATNLTNLNDDGGENANIMGWIDFDGNGTFEADEASASVSLPTTNNNQSFNLTWSNIGTANDINFGNTYIRIRTASVSEGLGVTSFNAPFDSGEVEDYALTIDAAAGSEEIDISGGAGFVNIADAATTRVISGISANVVGETVTIDVPTASFSDGPYTDTVAGDGSWSVTISAADMATLADATVYSIDASLSSSSATDSDSWMTDLTAPTAPAVFPTEPSNQKTFAVLQPTIVGTQTVAAGESLTVTIDGETFAVTSDGSGNWELDLVTAVSIDSDTVTLVDGNTYSVVATVTDQAGNSTSDSSNNEVIIDTSAILISIDAISTDDAINKTESEGSVIVSGHTTAVSAGRTVTVDVLDAAMSSVTISPNTTTVQADGSWSLTISSAELGTWANENHTFTASVSENNVSFPLADTTITPLNGTVNASYGAISSLYNGVDDTDVASFHIDRDGGCGIGCYWGLSILLENGDAQVISEVAMDGRNDCCSTRANGFYFRLYNDGVYTGTQVGPTTSGAGISTFAVSDVLADEIRVVIPDGGNNGQGNGTGNFTELFVTGEAPAPTASRTVNVDKTEPTVSITGVPVAISDTTAFAITVNFNEDVQNFGESDLGGSGYTVQSGSWSKTNDSTYVATIVPNGSADVVISVAAAAAQDEVGNDNVANSATATWDATEPRISSIVRQVPTSTPTNADTLTWRITFDENVSNVSTGDFTLSGSTGSITNVSTVTPSTVFDITASGGDLASVTGTVTFTFAGAQDITDTAGNDLTNTTPTGTNNNSYVLDNTAPGVTSITRQTPSSSPTNADSLTWRVTFDEDVQNVNAADFSASGTTATVSGVSAVNATTYDITISGGNLGSLNTTATLSFDGGQNIADLLGNTLTNTTPTGTNNNTYLVDNDAPGVTSITRQTPSSSPTNADSLTWRVTFDEDVANVGTGDFSVSGTTASVSGVSAVNASTYDVTVSGGDLGSLDATATLAFDGGQDIADLSGNALTNTTPSGTNNNTYLVDNDAPGVTSITRQTPSSSPTNADSLTWRVTFDEDVANVGTGDFSVGGTTASVSGVSAVNASTYDVTVSGGDLGSLDATATLAFDGGQDIADLSGNALTNTTPSGTNNNTYLVDNDAPGVTSITRQTPSSSPTNADSLTWRVTFDEDVANVGTGDFSVSGTTASVSGVSAVNASTYDVTVSGGDLGGLDATATLSFDGGQDIADLSGNALTNTTPTGTNNNTYLVDNDAPGVTSITRQTPSSSPTNADSLTWRVTFDEDVANVGTGDFSVGGTTASVSGVSAVNASTYDVTVSGGDLGGLDATATLAFDGGQDIADLSGNALTNTTPSGTNNNTYLVDNDAPGVTSITRQTPSSSPTNADSLTWRVTFDEDVANVGTGDFSVGGTTASVSGVSAVNASTYDVTVSGGDLGGLDATATLSFDGGQDIADIAGNALTNTTPTGTNNNTYLVDNDAPGVTSITRQTPSSSPTNADSLTWRVTFDEDVANVGTGDFSVGGTTASVSGVSAVNASTYDVTVSGGDLGGLDATATLSFDGGQDIADIAGNALTNTTPSGTNNNTYLVDNDAPGVTSITRQTPSSSPTNADSLTWRVTFDEDVANVGTGDFSVSGTTASVSGVSAVNASTYDVTVSGGDLGSLDATATLAFDGGQDIADLSGNALTNTTPSGTNNNTYLVDNDAPGVTSITRQTPSSSPTNADSLTWRVTFDEDVANVGTGDFSVSGTTASVSGVSAVNASTYDVTVSGGDLGGLDATAALSFDGGQDITDIAGNALSNTTPSGTNNNTYVVDNTDPVVGINALVAANDANKAVYPLSGSCTVGDGSVTVTITGITAQTPSCSAGGGWGPITFDVSGLSDGPTAITVNAEQTDSAGNTGDASQLQAAKDVAAPTAATCTVSPNSANDGRSLTATCTGVETGGSVTIPNYSCAAESGNEVVCTGTAGPAQVSGDRTATAADAAGNTATSTAAFTLDNTPPSAATCTVAPNPAKDSAALTATCTGVETGGSVTIPNYSCAAESGNEVVCTGTAGSGLGQVSGDETATAADAAGNTATSTAAFTLDNTPPSAATCTVAPNPAKDSAALTATCTGVETGGSVTIPNYSCAAESGNEVVCTGTAGSGLGQVSGDETATASDAAGNTATSTAAFTLDNTPPSAATCTVAPNPAKDSAALTATCTGVESGGSVTIPNYSCAAESGNEVVCTGTAGSGLGQVSGDETATASDAAGNTATSTAAFTLDNTPPSAATCTVAPNPAKDGAALTATCTGVETGGSVTIPNYSCAAESGNEVVCTGTAGAAQVSGDRTATAADAAGNTATSTAAFTLDNTPPTAATCTVAPNPAKDGDSLTATCTGVETGGSVTIPNYSCAAESGNEVVCTGTAGAAQVSGDRTATAADAAGNTATSTAAFTLDNTPPSAATCTVAPNPAKDGAALTATCTGVETGGSVTIPNYSCGAESGNEVVCTGTAGAAQVSGDRTATAADAAGNTATSTAAFTLDNTPPTAATCAVAPNPAKDGAALTATCTGVETGGSVSIPNYSCAAESGNEVVCTGTAGAAQVSGDRTATAADAAGNTATSTAAFTLDNTSPSAATCTVAPNPAKDGAALTATCTGVESGGSVTIPNYSCAAESGNEVVCTGTAGSGIGQVSGNETATAADAAGNAATSTAAFTLDNTPPSAATCTVAPNPAKDGDSLTATCTGVETGGSVTIPNYSCAAESGNEVVCTGTAGSGGGQVSGDATATTFDPSGNSSTSNTPFTLDNTDPVVSINALVVANNANKGTYPVSGTCTTGDGNVTVTISGVTAQTPACAAGTWGPLSFDVSGLTDGPTAITVNAEQTDSAGNKGDATPLQTSKDIVAPTAATCTVAPNPAKDGDSLTATCTGVETGGSVSIPNYSCAAESGNEVVCTGTAGSGGGQVSGDATATTFDPSGNSSTSNTPFTLDNTDPVVAINPIPQANGSNETSYPASGTCTTGDGVVTVTISGVTAQTPACSAGTWGPLSFDVSGLDDGPTAITVNAEQTDTAGNRGTATQLQAEKDADDPVVTINALVVANDGNKGSYPVSGTCTTGDGNVTVTISGVTAQTPACTAGTWGPINFDVSGLTDGPTAITVNAEQTDGGSNTGNATPLQTSKDIVAPTAATCTVAPNPAKDGDSLTATCTGVETGGSVSIPNYSCAAESGNEVVCTGTAGSGGGQVSGDATATTFDPSGNSSTSNTPFTLDNTDPVVSINALVVANNANKGTYPVSGTCTTGDGNVTVTISGVTAQTPACTAGTWGPLSFDVSGLTDGPTAITVNAEQTDSAGNKGDATPLQTSKDIVAPTAATCTVVPNPAKDGDSLTATCTGVETGGSVTIPNYSCAAESGNEVVCTGTAGSGGGQVSGDATATTFDPSGNSSTSNTPFTLDNAPPSAATCTVAPNPAKDSAALTATCTGVETGGSVTIPNYSCGAESGNEVVCTGTAGSGIGQVSGDETATAADAAGNTATSTAAFTLDNTAPSAATCSVAPNPAKDGDSLTATCTGVETGGSVSIPNYSCAAESGNEVECTGTAGTGGGQVSGDETATAADAAGNTATSTAAFTLDNTDPVVSINALVVANNANKGTYPVSGTCTTGDGNVTVTISGVTAQTPACTDGTWGPLSFDVSGLTDGPTAITVNAEQTDSAGNKGDATPLQTSKDIVAPTAATCTVVPNPAKDGDSLTATCTGVETGGSVTIPNYSCAAESGNEVVCTGTAGSGGGQVSGDVTATTFDPSGNSSTSNTPFTLDNTDPVVSINALVVANNANKGTYPVSGTCTTGDGNVTVTISGVTAQTPACTAGTWGPLSFDVSGLTDGPTAITVNAEQTDSAGNKGDATPLQTSKDIVAPTAATCTVVPNPAKDGDSLTATCTGVETGGSVTIPNYSCAAESGNEVVCTGTAGSGGGQVSGDATATTFDPSGNSSTSNTPFTLDNTDPVVSINALVVVNNANKGTYPVSGTCTTGDGNVTVTISGVTAQTPACTAGTWGPLSFDVSGLTDGPTAITVNAEQTDSAGNKGDATPLQTSKDIVAPTAATCTVVPNPAKDGDSLTATCTGVETGGSVTIPNYSCAAESGNEVVCTGTAGSGGGQVSGDATATTFDPSGNSSTSNTPFALDNVPPAVPTVPYLLTSSSTPTIGGTAEANSELSIIFGGATYVISVPASGNWSLDTSATIPDAGIFAPNTNGINQVALTSTDAAGNSTNDLSIDEIEIDTTDPSVGINAITAVTLANEDSYPVSGTCEVGSGNVTVTIAGLAPQTPACSAGGTWGPINFNVSGLGDGPTAITVNASQNDLAGNTGDATQLQTAKDTTPPNVAIDTLTPANDGNKDNYPVSGTCETAEGNVTVTVAGLAPVLVACSSGTWSTTFDVNGISDSPTAIVVDATQTDGNGNQGNALQLTTEKDVVFPTVGLDAPTDASLANVTNYPVSGTCTDGQGDVVVSITGLADSTVSCSGGVWNTVFDVSAIGDGVNALEVSMSQTDSAGNTSTDGPSYADKDATAPVVSIDTPPDVTPENEDGYPLTGTCDSTAGNVTVSIAGAGSQVVACTGDTWGPVIFDVTGITGGLDIEATQTDGAGNTGGAETTKVTDSDGDGVPDSVECPELPCKDTDGDGIPDSEDDDSDGDGIPDSEEGAGDTDDDGIPDFLDPDADNDGIPDVLEGSEDTDGDGIPDFQDDDADNDGMLDGDESEMSPPTGMDSDGDGIDDAHDVDATGGDDEIPPPSGNGIDDLEEPADFDDDGIPDFKDPDSDGDGIPDSIERGDVLPGQAPVDTDGDGNPDYLDIDSDNDGIGDSTEDNNVTLTSGVVDDMDGDGIADNYDVDFTGGNDINEDGVDDAVFPSDTDSDTVPDHLDLDSDHDSIPDSVESGEVLDENLDGTSDDGVVTNNPNDTDGDGIPDYKDLDSNNDGINDLLPVFDGLDLDGNGAIDLTEPDMDGDGIADAADSNPSVFGTNEDTDGDGIPAGVDDDDDNDGIPDSVEAGPDLDGNGYPDPTEDTNGDGIPDSYIDTDGDGIPDYLDVDSDNDGIVDAIEIGGTDEDGDGQLDGDITINGTVDPGPGSNANGDDPVDTDGDGVDDYRDLDSDNDGITDVLENGGTDEDQDGTQDGSIGGNGQVIPVAGSGAVDNPKDTDGDGSPDYIDTDSDNDGFSDIIESGGGFDANGNFLDANNDGMIDSVFFVDADGDGVADSIDGSIVVDGVELPAGNPVEIVSSPYTPEGGFETATTVMGSFYAYLVFLAVFLGFRRKIK